MIKYYCGKSSLISHKLSLINIIIHPKLTLSFLVLEKMSAAFIGMFHFDAWDISYEFMVAFIKDQRSRINLKANKIEKEVYEILGNIQSSFYSSVIAFTTLERKHDEIADTI